MSFTTTDGSTLPPGLTFTQEGSTDVLSGTPTNEGNYSFDLEAMDSNGQSFSPSTITVSPPAMTTTVLSTDENPATPMDSVTFVATVSPTPDGGTVSFSGPGGALCTDVAINDSTGQASCATSFSAPGSFSIGATYNGDPSFDGSNALTYTEVIDSPIAFVDDTPTSPTTVGADYDYFYSSTDPTGESDFRYVVTKGSLPPGLYFNADHPGELTGTPTQAGTYTFMVEVSDLDSSASTTNTIVVNPSGPASTTTALTTTSNTLVVGQSVTFTATVSPPPDGGTVDFAGTSDTACLAAAVNTTTGVATCTTSFSSTGTPSVTATYSGDPNYLTSTSNTEAETVSGTSTTTVVTSSANPIEVGASVVYFATVTPIPSGGTVDFVGPAGCTAQNVDTSDGVAMCSTSYSSAGPHTVTADYSGSTAVPADDPSSSLPFTETVNPASTTTALTTTSNTLVVGQSVTFTATVSPPPDGGHGRLRRHVRYGLPRRRGQHHHRGGHLHHLVLFDRHTQRHGHLQR